MRFTYSRMKTLRVIMLKDDGDTFSCVPCMIRDNNRLYFFAMHHIIGSREELNPVRMNVDFIAKNGKRITRDCFVYHIGAHYYAEADSDNFITVAESAAEYGNCDTVMLRHRFIMTDARRIGTRV